MASTMTSTMTTMHAQGLSHYTAPPPSPRVDPRWAQLEPQLVALYNEWYAFDLLQRFMHVEARISSVKQVDETALSTIIRDVEGDHSLIPLLCNGVRSAVQKYYEHMPAVPPSVSAELRTELTIVKLIKDNMPVFEIGTQDLIRRFL